ncbi:protein GVQW3-like [Belonocnema kinseyi]|uniref:protein GVQW3-like n=1 Tax=Belonocnema kinseyi TaxID=2817044 RepID=UPI00143E0C28|nr:protein GVQW3-like [Belonocnema kinseyi]
MAERTEQRICIKSCFNLGKSCAKTIEMLQKAFKDECMDQSQMKEWYRRFKSGRRSVESDPRSGRPPTGTSSDNVERVRVAVEQDRRLTVRELEDELGISKSTVWRILTKSLGITRVCALISGNIDISILFNQMGTTLKDATPRMTKKKSSAKKSR